MRRYYRAALWTLILVLITACGQGNVPLPTMSPTLEPTATFIPTATPQAVTNETLAQARPALIRIVNTVVDSPPLNVFAGFSAIATNLSYKQFTEPTSFDAGDYEIKIQASGAASSDTPLLDSSLAFPSGDRIIILITGSTDALALTVVPDTQEALKADESIIHLINALSDTSALTLRSGETDLTAAVGTGRDALSPIIPAEATEFTLQIGDSTLAYPATLKPQTNTTLIAVGNAASPAVIQFDANAPSRIGVRAINAAPEITNVDIYLDDELLNAQLEYGRFADRKNFASGQYTVRVYAAGADRSAVEPLTGSLFTLELNENFVVVLLGSASNLRLLTFAENIAPTQANQLRLSLLNTLPNFQEVDVQTPTKPIRGIPTLFYGQAPAIMDVEAGSYNFLMSAVDGQNERVTAELAENVQFEPGYNYLYLVTGRQDSNPLILSEQVGTVAAPVDGETQTTGESSSVRFINSVEGQILDFGINGAAVISGLNYGEGSALLEIADKNVTIITTANGQTAPLGQQEIMLEANNSYTIIAYAMPNRQVGTLVINDSSLIFDGRSPHVRFINTSVAEESLLGLALSEPDENPATEVPEPVVTEEPTQDPNQAPTIFTLPFGIQKLVSDILPGSASSVILMANGTYELHVIESARNKLAFDIPAIAFSGAMHLDVIAYQLQNSDEVKAFTVIYPAPPA